MLQAHDLPSIGELVRMHRCQHLHVVRHKRRRTDPPAVVPERLFWQGLRWYSRLLRRLSLSLHVLLHLLPGCELAESWQAPCCGRGGPSCTTSLLSASLLRLPSVSVDAAGSFMGSATLAGTSGTVSMPLPWFLSRSAGLAGSCCTAVHGEHGQTRLATPSVMGACNKRHCPQIWHDSWIAAVGNGSPQSILPLEHLLVLPPPVHSGLSDRPPWAYLLRRLPTAMTRQALCGLPTLPLVVTVMERFLMGPCTLAAPPLYHDDSAEQPTTVTDQSLSLDASCNPESSDPMEILYHVRV